MSLPLISILIPTYNQKEEYLRQSIDSALAQTYPNIEVIVSDNHSTNNVPEVLDSYNDNRLRIVKPPEHLPITPNFQFASDQAKGEYISFLCSDDWLDRTCIERNFYFLISSPGVVACFCKTSYVKQDNSIQVNANFPDGIIKGIEDYKKRLDFTKTRGSIIGCLIDKKAYNKIDGISADNIQMNADQYLLLRLCTQGDIAYLTESLAYFRLWDNPYRVEYKRTIETIRDGGRILKFVLHQTGDFSVPLKTFKKIQTKGGLTSLSGLIFYKEKCGMSSSNFIGGLRELNKIYDSNLFSLLVKMGELEYFKIMKGIIKIYLKMTKIDIPLKDDRL